MPKATLMRATPTVSSDNARVYHARYYREVTAVNAEKREAARERARLWRLKNRERGIRMGVERSRRLKADLRAIEKGEPLPAALPRQRTSKYVYLVNPPREPKPRKKRTVKPKISEV